MCAPGCGSGSALFATLHTAYRASECIVCECVCVFVCVCVWTRGCVEERESQRESEHEWASEGGEDRETWKR